MSDERIKLEEYGDPQSELNIQRRLRWLRAHRGGGFSMPPQEWIDRDPALRRDLEERGLGKSEC